MRFSEISIRQSKSKIKAGEGLESGTFKFFTSGETQSKFLDTAQYQGPALIFGTGGSPSIHYCEEEFSTSTDCVVYYPTDDSVDFYCAYQFFKSHMYLLEKGFRGAGLKHIKKEYIENIEINWLNEEQRNVVTGVSKKIDNLIAKRKIQLDKLETLSSALFYGMFGNPIRNDRGWDVKMLMEAAANERNALKAGPFGSSLKKEFYKESGYKIYGQEQVIANDVNVGNYYIDESKYRELKSCAIKEDDVLISLVGTFGKLLIVPKQFEPGIINPRLIKISFNRDIINTIYFKKFFLSQATQQMLKEMTHGQTMGVLNLGILKQLIIPVPPLPLQQEFADKIKSIERQKDLVRKSIKKLELLKNSLMQQYFA